MIVRSQFKPAWWLPGPHLQTLVSRYLRQDAVLARRHEVLALPDGDELHLKWAGNDGAPLVILLHGLGGSVDSPYIKRLQLQFQQHGWRSVGINFRGAGSYPNNRARGYHSGDTQDLHFVYHHIRGREPMAPLAAVGVSLGGNVLLKWLGERSGLVVDAAVAVSVPMLLDVCADKMDRGFSKVYRRYLTKQLNELIALKIVHLKHIGQIGEAERLEQEFSLSADPSFWEFDDKITAPLHGFKSAQAYYDQSSSRQFLPNIQTPTLIIQALDDPFMTSEVIPNAAELPEPVTLELSNNGGHLGFVQAGSLGEPTLWLEQRIPEFLSCYL